VEIQFTGLREGEKLNEELFYGHEKVIRTSCEKIKRTNGALRNWAELCRQLDELRASMSIDGAAPIRSKIKEIVPEYSFHENVTQERVSELPVKSLLQKAAGQS
jgi:FlaA1/EpsC-like NDP-sugar epimerase